MSTSANINMWQVLKGGVQASLSFYLACAIQTFLVLFLTGLICYLSKNVKHLQDERVKKRVGASYQKFNIRRAPKAAILVLACGYARNFGLSYMITFGSNNLML